MVCENEPLATVAKKRKVISDIANFRNKYNVWYNRFKHTNSVFAVGYVFDVPSNFSVLHMVPEHLQPTDDNVILRDKQMLQSIKTDYSLTIGEQVSHVQNKSFLTAYQNIDDVGRTLASLERFWQPIRAAQHKALFGEAPPN